MKTIREILLARHEAVVPKLDRIRADVLSAESARGDAPHPLFGLALTLWRELVWPSRRVWAGLACAWLLILGLNAASSVPGPRGASPVGAPSVADLRAIREQRQMLTQLMGTLPEPAHPRKAAPPGPHSERPIATAAA
ncbi:hypothetical protein HQ590_04070 [bacterium]|nr:hypothetical protein [bacterium]